MGKLLLDRVTSSFGFQAAFNSVLERIEQEFSEKVLYRDNPVGTLNHMSSDLDMNEHNILNIKNINSESFSIKGVDVTQSLEEALESVAAYPAEAKVYRDEAEAFRDSAADQVVLCEAQAVLASEQVALAEDQVDLAIAQVALASGFASDAEEAAASITAPTILAGSGINVSEVADELTISALDASETVSGIVELATTVEAAAGVDTSRAVTSVGVDAYHKANNIVLSAVYTAVGNETHIDFGSDVAPLPAGIKRLFVMFKGVSTNGTSIPMIQLGAESFVTSGYVCNSGYAANGAASSVSSATSGFILSGYSSSSSSYSGIASVSLSGIDSWSFCWIGTQGEGAFNGGGGYVSTPSDLDRVRITTVNGTDLFDAGGKITLTLEF